MFKNRRVRNPGSFGALFESHVDAVYEAAWLILRDRDQAAEVTRDAFADAWAEARSVPADMADMWVLARARDRAFDRVRAQDPARLAAHPPPAERPPQPLGVLLRAQIVRSLTTQGIPARAPTGNDHPASPPAPPDARPTTPSVTDPVDRHAGSTAGQDPGGDGSTVLSDQDVDGAADPRQADAVAVAGQDQATVRPGETGDHPGHQAPAPAGAGEDHSAPGPTAETRRSHSSVAGRDVAGSSSDPGGAADPRHADPVAMAGQDQAAVRPGETGEAGDHLGHQAPADVDTRDDGRTVAGPNATTDPDHGGDGDGAGTVVGGEVDGTTDPHQTGRTVAGSDTDTRDDGRTLAGPNATTDPDHGGDGGEVDGTTGPRQAVAGSSATTDPDHGGGGTVVGGEVDGAAGPRQVDAVTGDGPAGRGRVASGFGAVGDHVGRRADPGHGGGRGGAAGRWWAVGIAAGVAVVVGAGVTGGGSGGGGGVEPAVAQVEISDGGSSPTTGASTTVPPTTAVAARPPTPVLPSPRPTTTNETPPPPTTDPPAPTPAAAPAPTAPAPTAPPPPPPEVTSLWGILLMDSGCPAGEQLITLTWTSSGATSGRMRPEGGSWVAVDVPSGTHRACTVPGRPWQLEVANAGGTDRSSIRLGV